MKMVLLVLILISSAAGAESKIALSQAEQDSLTRQFTAMAGEIENLKAEKSRLNFQKDQLIERWDKACDVIKRAYRDGADLRGTTPSQVCRN